MTHVDSRPMSNVDDGDDNDDENEYEGEKL